MTDEHLKKLREYNADDRVVTSHEMKLAFSKEADNVVDVKSLIPGIDQACEGFRDGELIVISGPPKNGKTLLAQSFTVNFCKQNHFPLWFTFEVPARQFLDQFKDPLPLIYMPQKLKPRAMDWFEDRVFESFEKYHTRIIFIDHLHYLVDLARQTHVSIEIGTIIRQLKTLAVNGNFVIFLLCHTKMGKQDGTLSYESIRDSSFISQESDTVIMIKRTPGDGEDTARSRVEFHRRTGILERTIKLIKINGVLRENATGQYN
jgi:archaellum biogenesis ATPase FlaH